MPILINESLCAFAPGFIGTGTTAFCFNDNYARFRYVSVHLDGRVETGGDQGRLRNIAAIDPNFRRFVFPFRLESFPFCRRVTFFHKVAMIEKSIFTDARDIVITRYRLVIYIEEALCAVTVTNT